MGPQLRVPASESPAIVAFQWWNEVVKLAVMPHVYASCGLFRRHLLCVRAWERMSWLCCLPRLHPALPGHHQGPASESQVRLK